MGRSVGRGRCGCVAHAWFRAAHDSIMSMGTVMSTSSRGSGAGIVCGWRLAVGGWEGWWEGWWGGGGGGGGGVACQLRRASGVSQGGETAEGWRGGEA